LKRSSGGLDSAALAIGMIRARRAASRFIAIHYDFDSPTWAKATGSYKTLANADKTAKLYQAEYLGSGTFIISKPKRKARKLNQSKVKSPQRGARKS
jgi:hypothetical protein